MGSEKKAFWISVGISCLMGIIVGILLVCLFQIGYFVIGGSVGAIIAIYTVVVLECLLHFHSDVILYAAIALFTLEFGIFAMIWDWYFCCCC